MVPDIGHVVSMMIRQMERSSIFSEANFVSHQQFCISKNPVVLDDLVYLSPKKDQIFPKKAPKGMNQMQPGFISNGCWRCI